jgi:hypothetical protein
LQRERVWLLRGKTGAEIRKLARKILELRHLIEPAERWRSALFDGSGVPVIEEAWHWNPNEKLLRDDLRELAADVRRREALRLAGASEGSDDPRGAGGARGDGRCYH